MIKRRRKANRKHVVSYTKKDFPYSLFIEYVHKNKDDLDSFYRERFINRSLYKSFMNRIEINKAKVERKYQ